MTKFATLALAPALVPMCAIALSAPVAAQAGHDPLPIQVQCSPYDYGPLCAALVSALRAAQDDRPVVVTGQADTEALSIRFDMARHTQQFLQGNLTWTGPEGSTGAGPTIELAVMDSIITREMLTEFAAQLVRHSPLPL